MIFFWPTLARVINWSHDNMILGFTLENAPFGVYTSQKWLNSNLHNLVDLVFLFLLMLVSCCLVQFWRSYRLHGESQHQTGNINIGQGTLTWGREHSHIGWGFPKIWRGTTIRAKLFWALFKHSITNFYKPQPIERGPCLVWSDLWHSAKFQDHQWSSLELWLWGSGLDLDRTSATLGSSVANVMGPMLGTI